MDQPDYLQDNNNVVEAAQRWPGNMYVLAFSTGLHIIISGKLLFKTIKNV
ncbi:hypothetical protein [Endozoicomonas atrinae]|nr:hypothetical protein [Endozoicomonas atrinae]